MAPGDWWDDKSTVDNGINPTTDLPWGVYPDKSSPTGYTHTASGTPVYKDGSAWSGSTTDRAINVNVAAPVTWGPSQTDDDGTVTGVPGAVYQINSRGDVSILNKPKAASQTATNFNDTNGDGYDDQTGLPNGAAYVGGKLYYHGIEINPDGSPKTATASGKAQILVDRDGSVTGRAGTSYYFDDNGNPHTLVTGSATSSSSGGGSSSGGSSSGGGSSAGGGLSTRSGGYNNTSTSIREGGYTNTNISEIGPLEAAMRASEFAANNALAKDKRQQELAALYSQQLRDTDHNAYQVFLEKLGGGRLDNALLSGENALSENALRGAATSLGALNGLNTPAQAGGGLQMTTGGGGLQLEGGGPTSPGGGLPSAPAATPAPVAAPIGSVAGVGTGLDMTASQAASNRAQGVMTFATPEEYAAYRAATTTPVDTGPRGGVGGMTSGSYAGVPYTATRPGGNRRYPDTMAPLPVIDPRIAAQATDDRQREMTTGGGGLTLDGIASPQVDPKTGQLIGPLPDWAKTSTIPARAGGGLTRGPAVIGDPQANGKPNPEVMIPHDPNMTYDVVPLQDMDPMMAQRAMGGLRRFAYGDYVQEDVNAVAQDTSTYNPAYQQQVYQQPASYGAIGQPAPVAAPVQQPVATQPAPTATAPTAPANNPAQIGTYSTAPGTAGTPVAAPVDVRGMTDVPMGTAPPVQGDGVQYTGAPIFNDAGSATPVPALVSGASGGSSQPSQAAFDEVMYTRLAATNPWMTDPTAFNNVDYLTRDPIARRNFEAWLTMSKGVPQESIDFAQARNRLGGASMASMAQGR